MTEVRVMRHRKVKRVLAIIGGVILSWLAVDSGVFGSTTWAAAGNYVFTLVAVGISILLGLGAFALFRSAIHHR